MLKARMIETTFLLCIILPGLAWGGTRIDTIARLSSSEGDVQVSAGGDDKWAAAVEGMELRPGARVKTGSKSSCAIEWSRGNVLKLTPFTNIRIERMDFDMAGKVENSTVDLGAGKVYAVAKELAGAGSSFEVRTATAVAGVRGTKFYVGVDADGTSTVGCAGGKVLVRSLAGGEVVLERDESTAVRKGEAPSAKKEIPEEERESFSEIEDSIGAVLEIMEPVGNLETDTTPVVVKGQTDPGNAVAVNGQGVTADGSGFFMVQVDLKEGVNQIKIETRNRNGKVTVRTRVIKYRPGKKDAAAPFLQITRPAGGFGPDAPGCSAAGMVSIECEITGMTEPDAVLTINRVRCPVEPDGSFSCAVTVEYAAPVIEVAATDPAGNRSSTIIKRNIERGKVEYLEIEVSPSTITANGQDTATVTVRAYNLLREPVSAEIAVQSSLAGSLAQTEVITDATGAGTVVFLPGLESPGVPVEIRASAGSVSAGVFLTLRPDVPPDH